MSKRALNRIRYPFIVGLGLFAYCLLISLAESHLKTNPADQQHQMGENLIEVKFGELLLDQCPDCHGIWFDHGEMEHLLDSLDLAGTGISESDFLRQPFVDTDEALRQCPECCRNMRKAVIADDSRLMVDVCPHGDGVWFDGGEWEVLIEELCRIRSGWQIAGLSIFANFQTSGFLMFE